MVPEYAVRALIEHAQELLRRNRALEAEVTMLRAQQPQYVPVWIEAPPTNKDHITWTAGNTADVPLDHFGSSTVAHVA